jgi:predicted O-methyltransferase YrrM
MVVESLAIAREGENLIMRYVKTLVESLSRWSHADGTLKFLGEALRETIKGDISQEEKVLIDRIESLREELNSSGVEISITDYGRVTPTLDLTYEEMSRGTVAIRTVAEVCERASMPYFWSLLLFKLVRKFRPSLCLELGTCLGISAAFQASALKLNGTGRIVTLEGADSLASLAKGHLQSLSLDNVSVVTGRFQDTLSGVLDTCGPVNYAFIDGHHDEQATLTYFGQIIPFLSERAIMIFDDISWSEGMKRAWDTIKADERVNISVDLEFMGICIVDSEIDRRQMIRIPMAWILQ